MSKYFGFFLLFLLLFSPLARAQNPAPNSVDIIVEEFRIKEGFAEAAPSVSVIESAEIKKKDTGSVSELLSTVPGLFVAENGGPNQSTSVFIRGSESRHTLVLIDSMQLNDPLNPSRGFDFSSLTTENIERIEIYRGAQSVRFGSDAIGGVINIITKQGAGALSGSSQIEVGSYSSLRASASASGSKNNFNYSFGASLLSSAGFSAADKNEGATESDGYQRLTLSARTGLNFSKDTNLNVSFRATELQTDLDAFGGPTGDDPNYTSNSKQYQGGAFLKSRAFDKRLSYTLGLTLAYNGRADENPPDAIQPNDATDFFTSIATNIESRNEFEISDQHSLQFGLQLRTEGGHSESSYNGVASDLSDHSIYTNGIYLSHKYQSEKFFSELGLRQDVRAQNNNITSTAAVIGYKMPENESVLRASYGTGFKTPSLYQLYSNFGNTDLIDEKSNSIDFSLEKKWGPAFFLSLSYFLNQYYDLIDFDLIANKYFNIAKSSSRGVEIQANWQVNRTNGIKASLTSLQTKNEVTGLKLLRRPEISFSVEGTYTLGPWESLIEYSLTGDREDIDPVSFARTTLPRYDLINLRVNYAYTKSLSFNSRIVNLLNQKYESIAGFGTSEFALYAGLTKAF